MEEREREAAVLGFSHGLTGEKSPVWPVWLATNLDLMAIYRDSYQDGEEVREKHDRPAA